MSSSTAYVARRPRRSRACGAYTLAAAVHCFTGSAEQLERYVERGYMIGLTGFVAMRERGAHVRAALEAGMLPLSQLLIEVRRPRTPRTALLLCQTTQLAAQP
jgi:Tat protein secretion system quality control protein TatD with DNase activity